MRSLLFLLLASTCFAQINIRSEYLPHEPIEAKCICAVPSGSELKVVWDVPEGVQSRAHPAGDTSLYLWAVPGKHTLEMIAVYQLGEDREVVVDIIDGKPIKETIRISTGIDVQRFRQAFTVGNPDPDDDDDEDDDGDDDDDDDDTQQAPFEAPGFAVLLLHEASNRSALPADQQAIFSSNDIANYLNRKAVSVPATSPSGAQTSFRFWKFWDDDYNSSQLSNMPEVVRTAYLHVQSKSQQRPWLAISRGTGQGGWEGPLPGSVQETLDLLRVYGGP